MNVKKILKKNRRFIFPAALAGFMIIFSLFVSFSDGGGKKYPSYLTKSSPVPPMARAGDEEKAESNKGTEIMSKARREEEILEENERKRKGLNYIPKTYRPGARGENFDEEGKNEFLAFSKEEEKGSSKSSVSSESPKKKTEIKSSDTEVKVISDEAELSEKETPAVAVSRADYKRRAKLYREIAALSTGNPGGAVSFVYVNAPERSTSPSSPAKPGFSGKKKAFSKNGTGRKAPVHPGESSLALLRNGVDSVYASQVPAVMDVVDGRLRGWTLLGVPTSAGTWDSLVISVNRAVSPEGREYSVSGVALDPKTLSPDVSDEIDRNLFQRLVLSLIGGYVDYKMTKAAGNGYVEQPKNVISTEIEKELSRYVTHVKTRPGRYLVVLWK